MTTNTNAAPDTEKRRYADGTSATGVAPLPDYSPRQQTAIMDLQALESMIGGRNGPSIRLRYFIGNFIGIDAPTAAQPPAGWVPVATDDMHAHFEAIYNGLEMSDRTSIIEGILRLAAAPNPHVQIPPENVHVDSDVSRKAEKVGTSAAPKEAKAEPVQQPDLLTRIKELERERDHALMAAEAEAREVDRLRSRPEQVPLIADAIREPKDGAEWKVVWWNESARLMLPVNKKLTQVKGSGNGTLVFTMKERTPAKPAHKEQPNG